ncbi:MAG: PRC-barrel domain-containing protein [Candidatus Saccharimonadales bacterium]
MLQLSGSLLSRPVMSLRTGGRVATTISPIINPNNLKVEGFYCLDSLDRKKQLVLLYQDIRDIINKGIIIDDHEVLVEPEDLIRLKDIMSIHFDLIGKQVVTVDKAKVGKVSDYAVETTSMYVQKIYATQSLLKSLTGGSLSIDRNQIVEITNRKIVIQNLLEDVPDEAFDAAPA